MKNFTQDIFMAIENPKNNFNPEWKDKPPAKFSFGR
jgi:hypothetical protein